MTSRTTLPSALEPYLHLPPETSLTLLTSTLSCSATWLTTRFIGAALSQDSQQGPVSIILISWLHDQKFWKTEIRRGTGLNIEKSNHFTFLDNLTTSSSEPQISHLLTSQKENPPLLLLILDSPEILLSTTPTTTPELNAFLLRLRSQVHSTILISSADQPLVKSTRPTPMEVETAAFVTSQAHSAGWVLSVRELETGAAKDVSGVLRITRGGGVYRFDGDEEEGKDVKGDELLYLVQRDGNAKVFGRGSDVS